jgi:hypothetical protein
LIDQSLAHPVHPVVPEETRECGTCSGCSTTTKTLTAPRPNVGHGYRGPMYCLSCNPRFFVLDRPMVPLGEDGPLIDRPR